MNCLPIPVAVLGSCVSRDIFNSRFNPGYKRLFDCVALHNQGSLLSVMSSPVAVDPALLDGLDTYIQREIVAELSREFRENVACYQPEYVIVDFFGDVRFGASQLRGGAVVTRNEWKICKSAFFRQEWLSDISPNNQHYFDLWKKAALDVTSFIRETVPNARVILHDALFVTKTRDVDGTISDLQYIDAYSTLNHWWSKFNDFYASNYADDVICVRGENTMSFSGHPWGPYGVHYETSYHRDFLTELTRIALRDARERS